MSISSINIGPTNPYLSYAGSPQPGRDAENGAEKAEAGIAERGGSQGSKPTAGPAPRAPDGHELTPQEMEQLRELQKRDREVRQHEQAHIAAGGRYVRGGASFEYQKGPDGKSYAVGGEVSIDTSPERDPKATIKKMETVRKAALAPARPSAKDRAVAAKAMAKEAEARAELAKEQAAGAEKGSNESAENGQDARTSDIKPGSILDVMI